MQSVLSVSKKLIHILALAGSILATPMARANDIDPDVNRVADNAPDAQRCKPIPQPECNAKRQRALEKSCVNAAEFNTLVANNDTPICDYEDEPMSRLTGWCPCGCFEASTNLLVVPFGTDEAVWETAQDLYRDRKSSNVVSLSEHATIAAPELAIKGIRRSTFGTEEEALYVFKTESGRTLKLTRNHGVLKGDGAMVAAHELAVGDALVTSSGERVAITAITRERTADPVYNFLVETESEQEHTLIAEGFIVGDLAWQNNLVNQLGSIVVRQ